MDYRKHLLGAVAHVYAEIRFSYYVTVAVVITLVGLACWFGWSGRWAHFTVVLMLALVLALFALRQRADLAKLFKQLTQLNSGDRGEST